MRFIVSRASDEYRDCEMPSPMISPHPQAWWDETYHGWLLEVETLDEVCALDGKRTRVIITYIAGSPPTLQIDDVSLAKL